jgi:hypothetical protein
LVITASSETDSPLKEIRGNKIVISGILIFIFKNDMYYSYLKMICILLILFSFSSIAEYNIMMFDSKQKERRWNVTFYDYSSNVMDAEALNNYGTKANFESIR